MLSRDEFVLINDNAKVQQREQHLTASDTYCSKVNSLLIDNLMNLKGKD